MIRQTFAALAVVGAALVGLTAPASAAPQAAPHCQYGSTYGTVVATASINAFSTGSSQGTVELCRDSNHQYWAFAIYNASMSASQWAQVWLYRYSNGILVGTVSCDSTGGNGNIRPGQTRCWTPKLNGVSVQYTFPADSIKYSSTSGPLAEGFTAITR